MSASTRDVCQQPPLFDLPDPPVPGWYPSELGSGAQVYWAAPAELASRLDAGYYVVTRRQDRLLSRLQCPLAPLSDWAEVNPASRRLPQERGYWLFDQCLYAQIRDVRDGCWLLGPELVAQEANKLPVRAAYTPQPGDLLLPRVYSSLHRAVMVAETEMPLVTSSAFALLAPRSRTHGLALLALLHHQVLGEQLWALASGTTVRAISASKVPSVQVPQIAPGVRSAVAARVAALLEVQRETSFPNLALSTKTYWLEVSPGQRQQLVLAMAREIEEMIVRALTA